MGEKLPRILPKVVTSTSLLGSFTCRKFTTWDRRLYFPSEGRGRKIRRLRPGLNPRTRVPKASTLTSRPPKLLKAYLYRFKIIDSPTCPCCKGDQHIGQLIYECELLKPQRDTLRFSVSEIHKWPTSKYKLISSHHKVLKIFTNQIYDSPG